MGDNSSEAGSVGTLQNSKGIEKSNNSWCSIIIVGILFIVVTMIIIGCCCYTRHSGFKNISFEYYLPSMKGSIESIKNITYPITRIFYKGTDSETKEIEKETEKEVPVNVEIREQPSVIKNALMRNFVTNTNSNKPVSNNNTIDNREIPTVVPSGNLNYDYLSL